MLFFRRQIGIGILDRIIQAGSQRLPCYGQFVRRDADKAREAAPLRLDKTGICAFRVVRVGISWRIVQLQQVDVIGLHQPQACLNVLKNACTRAGR